MIKLAGALAASAIIALGSQTMAGSACCPAGKTKSTNGPAAAGCKAADKTAPCGAALEKLGLTEDQKTKIETLKSECNKGGCTETSRTKFISGLKTVLTVEQFDKWKAECAKTGQCPMKKSAGLDAGGAAATGPDKSSKHN